MLIAVQPCLSRHRHLELNILYDLVILCALGTDSTCQFVFPLPLLLFFLRGCPVAPSLHPARRGTTLPRAPAPRATPNPHRNTIPTIV